MATTPAQGQAATSSPWTVFSVEIAGVEPQTGLLLNDLFHKAYPLAKHSINRGSSATISFDATRSEIVGEKKRIEKETSESGSESPFPQTSDQSGDDAGDTLRTEKETKKRIESEKFRERETLQEKERKERNEKKEKKEKKRKKEADDNEKAKGPQTNTIIDFEYCSVMSLKLLTGTRNEAVLIVSDRGQKIPSLEVTPFISLFFLCISGTLPETFSSKGTFSPSSTWGWELFLGQEMKSVATGLRFAFDDWNRICSEITQEVVKKRKEKEKAEQRNGNCLLM